VLVRGPIGELLPTMLGGDVFVPKQPS